MNGTNHVDRLDGRAEALEKRVAELEGQVRAIGAALEEEPRQRFGFFSRLFGGAPPLPVEDETLHPAPAGE